MRYFAALSMTASEQSSVRYTHSIEGLSSYMYLVIKQIAC